MSTDDLFAGLVDDAAVFPPGDAPLDVAVSQHAVHRREWYSATVGVLLCRAGQVDDLRSLLDQGRYDGPQPLHLGVVAPGVDEARVARARVAERTDVEVHAVELPLAAAGDLARDWATLGVGHTNVWWEVDRGADLHDQLGAVAALGSGSAGSDLAGGAKLRTGGPTAEHVPGELEVATFLRECIDHDVTFKLTAGLHHAVRTTDEATGLDQHGVLNVLAAVHAALGGCETGELAALLAERDAATVVEAVRGIDAADAAVVRAFFASFGCCGVTDPVEELAHLGLLHHAKGAA